MVLDPCTAGAGVRRRLGSLLCAMSRKSGSPVKTPSGVAARGPSISPAKGDDEVSMGLFAILGDLVLADKEAEGLVIKGLPPLSGS